MIATGGGITRRNSLEICTKALFRVVEIPIIMVKETVVQRYTVSVLI